MNARFGLDTLFLVVKYLTLNHFGLARSSIIKPYFRKVLAYNARGVFAYASFSIMSHPTVFAVGMLAIETNPAHMPLAQFFQTPEDALAQNSWFARN
jgi:hypothetical protein